jgi:uncharacterized membrane protein
MTVSTEPPVAAPSPILPPHIEATIQAIARLHVAHHRRATPTQKVVERMIAVVGHPSFIAAITFSVVLWIGGNLFLWHSVRWSLDRPAFPWLQGAGELAALYITALVLISQRRKDELAELREQLTLELAIMTEQKGAKIIALLEEMRRDDPLLANRLDSEAEAMAQPADPEAVFEAFKETNDGMISAEDGA